MRVRHSFDGGKGIEKQVEEYKAIKEDWTVQGKVWELKEKLE